MSRVLLAIDGDNCDRVMSRRKQFIDYGVLDDLVRANLGSESDVHYFRTTKRSLNKAIVQEEVFARWQAAGFTIHRWADGHGGYPDSWLMGTIEAILGGYTAFVLTTADRDYLPLLGRAVDAGLAVGVISPQQVPWPNGIKAHTFDRLRQVRPQLLRTSRVTPLPVA